MSIGARARDCDKFGAGVHLTYEGKSQIGTLGGGMVTICLSILILTYLCMRTVAITRYADPAISSFIIYEDRSKMDKPINLAENN